MVWVQQNHNMSSVIFKKFSSSYIKTNKRKQVKLIIYFISPNISQIAFQHVRSEYKSIRVFNFFLFYTKLLEFGIDKHNPIWVSYIPHGQKSHRTKGHHHTGQHRSQGQSGDSVWIRLPQRLIYQGFSCQPGTLLGGDGPF